MDGEWSCQGQRCFWLTNLSPYCCPPAAGEGREGVAVQAFYAAGGSHFALTWEQLHGATAGELDARLALQTSSAADPQAVASADVLLPLGLSPACPAVVAAAGDKAAGSAGSEAAAALAADRLAFAGRAAELGFSAVPAMRLQLSELADAAGAQQLADLAAYAKLEAWAAEHQAPDGAPRLAVRAEVSSHYGTCLLTLSCLCSIAAFHIPTRQPSNLLPAATPLPSPAAGCRQRAGRRAGQRRRRRAAGGACADAGALCGRGACGGSAAGSPPLHVQRAVHRPGAHVLRVDAQRSAGHLRCVPRCFHQCWTTRMPWHLPAPILTPPFLVFLPASDPLLRLPPPSTSAAVCAGHCGAASHRAGCV